MKDAFMKMGLGFVLIFFSIPCLWVNESRNATLECTISCGEKDFIKGEGNKEQLLTQNGSLLHMEGEQARATKPIQDARFDVKFDATLRLRTEMEIFQWVENQRQEEQEEIGGGKTTVTIYDYEQKWSSSYNDGSNFNVREGHQNSLPIGLRDTATGTTTVECEMAEYGSGHTLPQALVQQLAAWQDADELVGPSAQLQGGEEWPKSGKYYYNCPEAVQTPSIGDGRVAFSYIPDGPVTVLALQIEGNHGKDTFAPYRIVKRGFCGNASPEDVKRQLIAESKLTAEDLAERGNWHSIFCCACSIVNMFFAALTPPQIFSAWCGSKSRDECFAELRASANCMKWGFRIVGWAMMFIGMEFLFEPLVILLAVIPFLAKLGSFVVGVVCFIASVTITSVIVCLAYMAYHPVYAIIRLCIVGAIASFLNYTLISSSNKTE